MWPAALFFGLFLVLGFGTVLAIGAAADLSTLASYITPAHSFLLLFQNS